MNTPSPAGLVDRIYTNCRVYTLDQGRPRAEAVAISGERIVAVGSAGDVPALAGPQSQVIDLERRTLVPGLTDAHNHLIHYGVSATTSADLSGSASIDEVLSRLRTFRAENPEMRWLLGHRFDQELFAERRWITRADLDRISPNVPIMVSRLCLHAIVVNSAALYAVKRKLSADQRKTGILTEDATGLIWDRIPPPTDAELEDAVLWATSDARRVGLADVHCQISDEQDLRVLRKLHAEGRLPIRVRVQCPYRMLDYLTSEGLRTGSGDDWLRIGSIKLYMDGGMGARTAAMKESFSDDQGNCGELLMDEHELTDALRVIQEHECQAAIHAIGDRAVECALAGIEAAIALGNAGNRLRHRIEHASQVNEELLSRMAALSVPAVVQPQFVITDFWTYERVGRQRYRWSNAFRSMLDAGIVIAMGSDCPVERLDPIELLERAVNREPRSLAQRLSVEEVIRAYSYGSAYVGFAESSRGTIREGMLADMCVLSDDPFEMDPARLNELSVERCIVGGS